MNRIQSVERRNSQLASLWHQYSGPDHQQRVLHSVIGAFKQEKTAPFEVEKVLLHQDNAICHKSIKTTAKLHELGYKLLPHSPYCPDLVPSDLFCLQTSKKCLLERNLALMKR
jgi:hypothetical protein